MKRYHLIYHSNLVRNSPSCTSRQTNTQKTTENFSDTILVPNILSPISIPTDWLTDRLTERQLVALPDVIIDLHFTAWLHGTVHNSALINSTTLQKTKHGAKCDALSYVMRKIYVAIAASHAADVHDATMVWGESFWEFSGQSLRRNEKAFLPGRDSSGCTAMYKMSKEKKCIWIPN